MSTTLSERDLAALEETAAAATQGYWSTRSHPLDPLKCFVEVIPPDNQMAYGLELLGDDYCGFGDDLQRSRDVFYVSQLSPDVVRELVRLARIGLANSDPGDYVVRYSRRLRPEPSTYCCTADSPVHAVNTLKEDLEISAEELDEIVILDVCKVCRHE